MHVKAVALLLGLRVSKSLESKLPIFFSIYVFAAFFL